MTEPTKTDLTKGERTKKQIVKQAAQLFIKNGYYATGIRDVIEAAQVSKGSFYFYFESKRDLGMAVYEYYTQSLLRVFHQIAEDRNWTDFVNALCEWIAGNTAKGINYGCPFATLGMETAFVDPELSRLNYESMLQTVEAFKCALQNTTISVEKAALMAERSFAMYEGYMLRYRLSKDPIELQYLRDALHSMI